MEKIIFWDFDGTLGYRTGNWEETIFELTSDKIKKSKAGFDLVSGILQTGFPWHEPQKSFTSITSSHKWWEYVKPKFIEVFVALGYDESEARAKADLVPQQYTKADKWELYSDTIPCLGILQNTNWRSILVTNNIPEFPSIVKHLGLENYFEAVFVSSLTGYNKPNPLILNGFLKTILKNTKMVVVGDREDSDLVLARAIKAQGILVRTKGSVQPLCFDTLIDLADYLLS
jgi:putative hydrolase of the HAD superfamily